MGEAHAAGFSREFEPLGVAVEGERCSSLDDPQQREVVGEDHALPERSGLGAEDDAGRVVRVPGDAHDGDGIGSSEALERRPDLDDVEQLVVAAARLPGLLVADHSVVTLTPVTMASEPPLVSPHAIGWGRRFERFPN